MFVCMCTFHSGYPQLKNMVEKVNYVFEKDVKNSLT